MFSRIKWLFTPKSDRPAYVLDWFNKTIAVHPKMAPYMNRLMVETAKDELLISISSGKYSDEQMWKVHGTNKYHLYTAAMHYPTIKSALDVIDGIIYRINEVDKAIKSLDKYYHRLWDKSNFCLTDFEYSTITYENVTVCPAGVLPLITATERDVIAQGLYDDEHARKADIGKYYDYIIKEFSKRLKGRKPQASSPHMDVKTFEEWRIDRDIIAKADAEEERLSKTCTKVLDDIRGHKNMGGGASCAAS